MSNNNINNNIINSERKKEYLGSRYSQQILGENSGSVKDSSNLEMKKKEEKTQELFWRASGEEDFTKEENISK
jgi:hypothetical protein